MRCKAWLDESNLKCHIVKLILPHVIMEWKSIHYVARSLEIPLSTAE